MDEIDCSPRADVIILCAQPALSTNTVSDHLRAFRQFSKHRFTIIDSRAFAAVGADLGHYGCLVLHYSVFLSSEAHIPAALARRIAAYRGLKVAYIQDEYRCVNRQNEALRDLGIDVVFTVTNPEVTRLIYRETYLDHVRFEHTLTGFVPEHLLSREVPPYHRRVKDVVYRSRRVPTWLGAFGTEKHTIATRFKRDVEPYKLETDISADEDTRIYGEDWIRFLENSKAVLGTESGASFIDFSGDIQKQVEEFERANPNISQEVVISKFLAESDGRIIICVVSPRIFEAAALRTLMILYEGSYSGTVEPWRHYVPLKRDHSNLDEVIDVVRNPEKATAIIDRAYREVALNPKWSFAGMVRQFDVVLEEELAHKGIAVQSPIMMPIEAALSEAAFLRLERGDYLESVVLPAHENLVLGHKNLVVEYQKLAAFHQKLSSEYQKLAHDYERRNLFTRALLLFLPLLRRIPFLRQVWRSLRAVFARYSSGADGLA